MSALWEQPVFGVSLTLLVYLLSGQLKRKFNFAIFNRILVSVSTIILLLLILNIDFETYNKGARYISFFLGPSVVALGVFVYEKLEEIKTGLKNFTIAVVIGGLAGIISVLLVLSLWKAPEVFSRSLIAKSVTTPIAIEITKITQGIPEITTGIVIVTGIIGNTMGYALLNLLGVKNTKSIGIALGTAAHGIGTARAFEIDKDCGVYAGLAMCLNGIITAIAAPYVLELYISL